MIVYVIQEIGGNKNSPDSLNVMVNYHYHGENRVIFPVIPIYSMNDLDICSFCIGNANSMIPVGETVDQSRIRIFE